MPKFTPGGSPGFYGRGGDFSRVVVPVWSVHNSLYHDTPRIRACADEEGVFLAANYNGTGYTFERFSTIHNGT